MDSLWVKIKQNLIDSASVAAEKAEYLGKVGRARLDIAETRHAIRDRFADLGGLVYESLQNDAATFDPEGSDDVKELISTIDDLEEELSRREAVLNDLRVESDDTDTAETA